jgi:hypothetical protein
MARSLWDPQLFADAFCERRTLALLDEPLNLATNLVLLAAGVALVRVACTSPGKRVPAQIQTLIGAVFLMAAASILLHARPTPLTELIDRAAVYFFVLFYVACFLHHLLGWRWRRSLAALPLLAALALAPRLLLPLPWSSLAGMLPAVAVCAVFAGLLAQRGDVRWRALAGAGLSFAIALAFHGADRPLCTLLPTGTHFLWHAFSGLTAYLAARVVVEQAMREPLMVRSGEGAADAPSLAVHSPFTGR